MPENPAHKHHPHPFKRTGADPAPSSSPTTPFPSVPPRSAPPYAELAVTTNFTFLTGASHPDEFVEQAAALGHAAAAIADTNTLAGIVRAHTAAKDTGIPLAVGCRLVFTDPASPAILVYPTSRPAYSRLSRLLTLGKRRAPKGECHLALHDLLEHEEGLLAVVVPPHDLSEDFIDTLAGLARVFDDDRLSLAVCRAYGPDDATRLRQLAALGEHAGVPLAAINDAHYHAPHRRMLQDVLTCIRRGCTIEEAGFLLHANAERHLKPADEIARLFADHPGAPARAAEVAARATAFSLDELRYEYPLECPPGLSIAEHLRDLTYRGAAKRYPAGLPDKVLDQIEHELALIAELRYEPYFLTCHGIVDFARSRGILCQGRGGAANSAVCYCLGITEVDPARFSLLFARFVSRERREPPDIDIDFEHERREEVIQHIYATYGRERAALTAEVISYRARSAVRDVGKAMGLSLDCVDTLAKHMDYWGGSPDPKRVREAGLNPADPTIRLVLALTAELIGFPRHLSQHVGGFVITNSPLSDLVPIENAAMEDRTVIEWDKDDIDAMGMLKVDVLGLGMLTCIRKAFELVEGYRGERLSIPRIFAEYGEDPAVYEMIQHADTLGVFQIESRAQMSMLPRLKPKCFYDLVIEVAIVRPGPIQGKMVHPYLRRRDGTDPITYPNPQIEEVLGRTLGVPLFQEQAMQLSIVAAGFSPDEADKLRRAMAAWKRKGDAINAFGERLIAGMLERGYPRDFAERCFEQIKGFSEYGFPESHAASFAILVYVSSWLKRYEPAAFAAALINSQPMGFYAPAQIVRDAREHGVEVRPIDVNFSAWDCSLEPGDRDTCATTVVPHSACWTTAARPRHDGSAECATDSSDTDALRSERRRGGRRRSSDRSGTPALRLGLRLVKGLSESDANRIAEAVAREGPFDSIDALRRAGAVSVAGLRKLARADAFGSMDLHRQTSLWAVRTLRDDPHHPHHAPLFESIPEQAEREGAESLPAFSPVAEVNHDYAFTSLSLKAHPLAFIREALDARTPAVTPAADLRSERLYPNGARAAVAGIVLVRQRPATASGIVFMTLEDETGIANIVVMPDLFDRFRKVAALSRALLVRGVVERQGEVVHLRARSLKSLDDEMPSLDVSSRNFH